jgi:hypothetical protein
VAVHGYTLTPEEHREFIYGHLRDMHEALFKRFIENALRIQRLLKLYQKLYGRAGPKDEAHGDLLRAAVVFMHATLEDFLRTIASMYMPFAGEKALDPVPLVGCKRGVPFRLGALAQHRGKMVEDLLVESVDAYLERRSFSTPREVAQLFEALKLPLNRRAKASLGVLNSLMRRRHQIVHTADRVRGGPAQPIRLREARRFFGALVGFVSPVSKELLIARAQEAIGFKFRPNLEPMYRRLRQVLRF